MRKKKIDDASKTFAVSAADNIPTPDNIDAVSTPADARLCGAAAEPDTDTAVSDKPAAQIASPRKKSVTEFLRTLKYIAFAASAGIIQFGFSTFFIEVLHWTKSSNLYWVGYLIALVLSVVWNFTFNRRYTFQSVANIPKAMMWTVLYYAIFTPCSIFWQDAWLALPGWGDSLEMIVMVVTILINGVTEFLWQRLFVYRKTIDTNDVAAKHAHARPDKNETFAADETAESGILCAAVLDAEPVVVPIADDER